MSLVPSDITLNAAELLDPSGSIVASGARLADALVLALEGGGSVEVSLEGVRGVSSSYFNAALRCVVERAGLAAVRDRVRFRFGSAAQELIFNRSLATVLKGAA